MSIFYHPNQINLRVPREREEFKKSRSSLSENGLRHVKSELWRAPLMLVGGCRSALRAESSLVTLGVTQLMFSADVVVMWKEMVVAA